MEDNPDIIHVSHRASRGPQLVKLPLFPQVTNDETEAPKKGREEKKTDRQTCSKPLGFTPRSV